MLKYIQINKNNKVIGYSSSPEGRPIKNSNYIDVSTLSNDNHLDKIQKSSFKPTWKSGTFRFEYDPATKSIVRTPNDTNQLECTIDKKRVKEGDLVEISFRILNKNDVFDDTFDNNVFIKIEESDGDVIEARIKIKNGIGSFSRVFNPNTYEISDIGNIIGEPRKIHVINDTSFTVYVE